MVFFRYLFFLKKSQYLYVFVYYRALQAVYNAGKARDIFYFKNGDALLFGLTCAQVMYGYTVKKINHILKEKSKFDF